MEDRFVRALARGIVMMADAFQWLAAAVGLLLLLVLISPLRIRVNGWVDSLSGADFALDFQWLAGFIGVDKTVGDHWRLWFFGLKVMEFYPSRKPKKEKKPHKKKTSRKKKSPLTLTRIAGDHFHTLLNVLGHLLRALFPRGFIVGRVGLPDPADTARVALANRMFHGLGGPRFEFSVTPVYDEEIIQIEAQAQVTLMPIYIGIVALLLLLQKQTRMMIYSFRHA